MTYEDMRWWTCVTIYILTLPFLIGTLINDLILGSILNINFFRTPDKDKVEEFRLIFSRWNCKPGAPHNQWPPSWNRFISSGPWGTVYHENSGEKKKFLPFQLDFHFWPVHKHEIEEDKVAPIENVDEFRHKLNQGLETWSHDYFYFFYKVLNIWIKVTKLSSLAPLPTTPEGTIFHLKAKVNQLTEENKRITNQLNEFIERLSSVESHLKNE